MKTIVCSILFANLLSLGTLKSTSARGLNPSKPTEPVKGDTVVVKLKNKNKVLIITDKDRDLSSFRTIDINKIIADVDSTLQRDVDLRGMDVNVQIQRGDSTIRIHRNKNGKSELQSFRIVVTDDNGVTITSGDTITREVKIYSPGTYRSRNHKSRIDDLFELDLGFNNYLENGSIPGDNNKPYGLTPFNSNYVAIRGIKQYRLGKESRFKFSVGAELAWNNYKFESKRIITKGSEAVAFDPPADSDWKISKSKLTISWLNIPVMLHYRAKHSSFHLAAGGFAGYRINSHSKIKYEDNGNTKKDHMYTNFYLNSVQYGARLQIGFHDVDFFAQYNLNELFASGKGPKLTPFAFGITL